jgi:hypothetical protein
VDGRNAAQAMKLVRALREQLHAMSHRLVRLERQDVTGTNGRTSVIRCEAAALWRDIDEAQILIDRLQRRYPVTDTSRRARPARHQAAGGSAREVLVNGPRFSRR